MADVQVGWRLGRIDRLVRILGSSAGRDLEDQPRVERAINRRNWPLMLSREIAGSAIEGENAALRKSEQMRSRLSNAFR